MTAESTSQTKLSNVLVAASLRADQWRQLNADARAWAGARAQQDANVLRERCSSGLAQVRPLEQCWAYPGESLLVSLDDALAAGDAPQFARLVRKVSASILSGDYRRDE